MTISRRHFLAALCGLPALTTKAGEASSTLPARYALTGTLYSGDGTKPLRKHGVIVENDTIKAVVPEQNIPESIHRLGNGFILPGIINCHVHDLYSPKERRDRFLAHGVTSIGNVASPIAKLPALLDSSPGLTTTTACTGPMLCPPGGYPLPIHKGDYGMIVDSPTKGKERVRHLADLGATMIKISFEPGPYPTPWPMFDAKTASAICDEARRLGLIIRCHVEDITGLKPALDAGVHTIEHVPHRWIENGKPRPILRDNTPIAEYRTLLNRMIRDGIILVPTLDVLSRSLWNGPDIYEPVRYFHNQGGRIGLGNDYPYRRTNAGMPQREMTLLGTAGLNRLEVLTAATSVSAAACGFTDRGIIAPKMKADLLLVQRDSLEAPMIVVKDGKLVSRKPPAI